MSKTPNPRRVAAGRRNRKLRGPLTPKGREKLRQAALVNKPWNKTTGPRTTEGKAQAALNGKKSQKNAVSIRELRALVKETSDLAAEFAQLRRLAMEQLKNNKA